MSFIPNQGTELPADDDPKKGNMGTSKRGARNKSSLRHDGRGEFKESDSHQGGGDGYGGGMGRPGRGGYQPWQRVIQARLRHSASAETGNVDLAR